MFDYQRLSQSSEKWEVEESFINENEDIIGWNYHSKLTLSEDKWVHLLYIHVIQAYFSM